MKTFYWPILVLVFFTACKNNENKKVSTVPPSTTEPFLSLYSVAGDSIVIPPFEIEVRPSDKAAQTMKRQKETVIVSAYFSGLPKDKKDGDEMGQIHVLDSQIELVGDNRIARFENLKFSKNLYNKLSDKDINLLINVYSGRRSSEDNLIESGIIDKKAGEFKDKRYVLYYKLINEPASVTGGASEIAACYALPPAESAPKQAFELLIECDSVNNMKWGDKPIKNYDEFKKVMAAELNALKKLGAEVLPGLKVEGCMMGNSGELRTIYEEVKNGIVNPKKNSSTKGNNKAKTIGKPISKLKSAPAPAPQVTQYENGTIKLNGKTVALENLRKELQAALLTYKVIPNKVPRVSVGTVGMGMRQEVETIINESIAGAKWVHKKNSLEAITIEAFTKLPPEIDGCSCYFSNNTTDKQAQKYIYADNYDKIAFVRINGVMEKLTLKKTSNQSSAKNVKNIVKQEIKTFANDKCEVTINIEKTGGLEEVWFYKGKMTVKNKKQQVVVKEIVGECGC